MTGFYAVSIDPHGRLGWRSPFIEDSDPGYDKAQIIEVLTTEADPRYLAYLRSLEIPYILAGETELDVALALSKLERLGVEKLLLEGGSLTNGAFLRAGAVDEISLVVAPVVADEGGKPLFWGAVFADYTLHTCENLDGVICLHYKKGE